ncbi:hypothetical protein GCM10010398_67460 [Streptomyces fimbriatus]
MVESTPTGNMSISSPRAASAIASSRRAWKTPASRPRMKRFQTVCQAPNRSGVSRHRLPVRKRRIAPSNCSRSRSGHGPNLPTGQQQPDELPIPGRELRACHTDVIPDRHPAQDPKSITTADSP